MSDISKAFANGKAFIPFITCGDPDLETTEECIVKMQEAGASMVELGIPFSDPTAEGPVIMEASIRALEAGCTTDKVFDMAARLRSEKGVTIPMVVMTYANVVFSYGIDRFCKRAAECGISGFILPDVPFEEKEEFASVMRGYSLDFVSLIAPTSEDRIAKIASSAEGFIYVVSSLGVTGVRSKINTDIEGLTSQVRSSSNVPCAIGFGISTPEQAKNMSGHADGVIVGSAIVKLIARHGKDAPSYVFEYVKSMVDAIS
ncbi:MAG: tryptophan synthase subunit alpha [Saccharofermentans sp.]|nr:tryptophan synthase subunit alpha [Saccharofermentans sp.]